VIAEPLRPLARPVADLRTLEGNPRRGDVAAVKRSLQRFGQRKPIVVREDGTVIAGNHTLLAARELGWVEIAVVGTEDDEMTAKAYALADNRTSALGTFDLGDLALMAAEVHAVDPELLEAASFTEADLNALLNGQQGGKTDPDDAPEAPAEPVTQPGDLWQLGPHRLLCGDATSPDDLGRVTGGIEVGIVYTDPPYGIDIVQGDAVVGGGPVGGVKHGSVGGVKIARTTPYLPVAGDDSTDVARDAFALISSEYPAALQVWWGGNHYAAAAGLPDASCWLVWDKENTGNFADAELAWTNHPGAVRLLRHMWNGMLRASERGKRVHPTQKPVALAEWAFRVIDPKDAQKGVLDVFAGSGSTLIAAHRTWRRAALVEKEASYVDLICRRYQEHTGTKPVLEATGVPHDFTA